MTRDELSVIRAATAARIAEARAAAKVCRERDASMRLDAERNRAEYAARKALEGCMTLAAERNRAALAMKMANEDCAAAAAYCAERDGRAAAAELAWLNG